MNRYAMLDKLNAISAEIADTTDTVLAGMAQGQEAMGKLNALQTGVQHLISMAIGDLRNSAETIPLELQKPDIAKSDEISETLNAPREGPQAQVSRETVTPAGELVGGVGDGTDAGGASGDRNDIAAQSVQAVAEPLPVEPGAAPDVSTATATDRVLELWQTGELTANEIIEQAFIGRSVVTKILRKARSVGDPRVVRGDLRKAEIADAKERQAQARDAEIREAEARANRPGPEAPPGEPDAATTKPALALAGPYPDDGTVFEICPTKVNTVRPDDAAIGTALAYVSIREGIVENGGEALPVSGAPLRVIAKLNDQRVYTADDLTAAGRYVSPTVFLRNLNDIQRLLARAGLHIVEYVGGGFQLRRVA